MDFEKKYYLVRRDYSKPFTEYVIVETFDIREQAILEMISAVAGALSSNEDFDFIVLDKLEYNSITF